MNLKILLSFALGAAIGVAGGILGTRSHYKSKYEKETEDAIRDMENYYSGTDEYARVPHEEDAQNEAPVPNEKEQLKEYAASEKSETIRYDQMYEVKEEDHNESQEESEIRRANEYHQKNRDRPPRIISREEASDLPVGWKEEPLYYYPEDDVLVDDFDNVVDDPIRILGDCMTKYGFSDMDNEEDEIYVKNYALDVVYWVQKVEGNFEPMNAD